MDSWTFTTIGIVFGSLILVSAGAALAKRRPLSDRGRAIVDEVIVRTNAWWVMATVFFGALLAGFVPTLLLFLFISFRALREYVTLLETRRTDHRALFWSFWFIGPVNYYLLYTHWYGLFAVFIPVYGFLLIPSRLVLSGDTDDFLRRMATIQWGLMVCVYLLSHAPALLTLEIPGFEGQSYKLLLFLVFITELSDILQFAFGKRFGRRRIAPEVSPNKTWEGLVGGVLSVTIVGALLSPLTPFTPLATAALTLLTAIFGFLGGLVMSAIKRDRGVKDFGSMIAGHGGMMDRVDSLCFGAPLFFHVVRYFYSV